MEIFFNIGYFRLLEVIVDLPGGNNSAITDLSLWDWRFADELTRNGLIVRVPVPPENSTRFRDMQGPDAIYYRAAYEARFNSEEELVNTFKTYDIDLGKVILDRFVEEDVDTVSSPNQYKLVFTILEEKKNITMTSKKKKQMAGFSSPEELQTPSLER